MAFDPNTAKIDMDPFVEPAPKSTQPPEKQKPWIGNPIAPFYDYTKISKSPQIGEIRRGIIKGGTETADLWQQGHPIQAYMHSLGTLGGAVGGAVTAPLSAASPRLAEIAKKGMAYAMTPRQPGEESRIPMSTYGMPTGNTMVLPAEGKTVPEWTKEHPTASRIAGDVMNTLGMIPAVKGPAMVGQAVAKPLGKGAGVLGERLIKPKVGEYLRNAPPVAREALGKDFKQQRAQMAKTIADEEIHWPLRDPEALSASATEKANNYVGQSYKIAVKKNVVAGNPVKAGKKAVEDFIASGKVQAGNVKLIRNAVKTVSEDMSTRGTWGYNKAMNESGVIDFKRALNPDWSKGAAVLASQPAEAAKNQVRKLMYYGADDLLTTPEVIALNQKATKLYRVADVLEGQVTKPWDAGKVLGGGGAIAAPLSISALLGKGGKVGAAGTAVAMLGAGAYSGFKSGAFGQGLLSLAKMGKSAPADVTAMGPAAQSAIAKLNLNSPMPPISMPGGKLGFVQAGKPGGPTLADYLKEKGIGTFNKVKDINEKLGEKGAVDLSTGVAPLKKKIRKDPLQGYIEFKGGSVMDLREVINNGTRKNIGPTGHNLQELIDISREALKEGSTWDDIVTNISNGIDPTNPPFKLLKYKKSDLANADFAAKHPDVWRDNSTAIDREKVLYPDLKKQATDLIDELEIDQGFLPLYAVNENAVNFPLNPKVVKAGLDKDSWFRDDIKYYVDPVKRLISNYSKDVLRGEPTSKGLIFPTTYEQKSLSNLYKEAIKRGITADEMADMQTALKMSKDQAKKALEDLNESPRGDVLYDVTHKFDLTALVMTRSVLEDIVRGTIKNKNHPYGELYKEYNKGDQ